MKTKTFTRNNIVTWLSRCMPNAEQINWIALDADQVRFEWRGAAFRVNAETGTVEEVEGRMLAGTDKAALIQALLMKQWLMESQK
jgi:hypothetical protein